MAGKRKLQSPAGPDDTVHAHPHSDEHKATGPVEPDEKRTRREKQGGKASAWVWRDGSSLHLDDDDIKVAPGVSRDQSVTQASSSHSLVESFAIKDEDEDLPPLAPAATVAEMLRRDQEQTASTFHRDNDFEYFRDNYPGVDLLGVSKPSSTPSDDGQYDSEDSEKGPTFSVITDGFSLDAANNPFKRVSNKAGTKAHAFYQITVKYKKPLENVLRPELLGKRPPTKWDLKLVKKLAELSSYVAEKDMDKLLWLKVGERQGQNNAQKSVVQMADVTAVIQDLEEAGFCPVKMTEEELYNEESDPLLMK